MEIRKATPNDALTISRIHALSWKAAYRGLLPESYLFNLKDNFWEEFFRKEIEKGTLQVDLLHLNQKAVGCIAYGNSRDEKHPNWGEIVSFYLLPEFWGQGYGTCLLQSALAALSHTTIYLYALDSNQRARHFYEKKGFHETDDFYFLEIEGQTFRDIRYILFR